jgi:hypothetical protein
MRTRCLSLLAANHSAARRGKFSFQRTCVKRRRNLMREIISTKDAPQAIGPYSQAIKANGFVFTSGQIAIDPATQQLVEGDVTAQTDRVLRNVAAILQAAGSGMERWSALPSSLRT